MKARKNILIIFILVALAQLAVPLKLIYDKEHVILNGHEFKFKTAPIDPSDPFRGKYITLSYAINRHTVTNDSEWVTRQNVYVELGTDDRGFAKINNITHEPPIGTIDYVTAEVNYVYPVNGEKELEMMINYPFDKFYMEESKASEAERLYWLSSRDTSQTTYTLVSVKEGDATVKDVLIGGKSIKELARTSE